jgi:hypothetical protein
MFLDDLRPEAVPSTADVVTGVTGSSLMASGQLSDGVAIDDEECEFLSAIRYIIWEWR